MKYLIKIKLKNNENFFWVTERLNHGKPCKYIEESFGLTSDIYKACQCSHIKGFITLSEINKTWFKNVEIIQIHYLNDAPEIYILKRNPHKLRLGIEEFFICKYFKILSDTSLFKKYKQLIGND